MHNNLRPMLRDGEFWHDIRNRLDSRQMTNYGDVFDTPPTWIRVLLGLACIIGGVLVIVHLVSMVLVVPLIVTSAALILTVYLLASTATSAQLAIVTVGFWAFLGILVLTLP